MNPITKLDVQPSAAVKSFQKEIASLAQKYTTPLFIIRKQKLVEEVERFKTYLPRVEPYYAVKANPKAEVLRLLVHQEIGFDVASRGEIETLLGLGVSPERMIFANTIKGPEVLRYAHSRGVRLMTFDSEYELNKIAKYAPGSSVLLRIKVPNIGSIVELSIKFGIEPADAIALLIKAHRLGLRPTGVSFHVGSQCTNIENYVEALEMASIIVRDAQLKQLPLEMVDIGGGFPIRHFDYEEEPFEEMAVTISKELDRLFDKTVRIIAEPGRRIVGPACILVMRVMGKSIRANKHWYYLDDGVYGTLSGIIYDHCKYQYKVFKKGPVQLSTLAGPTCDSLDVISYSEDLPELEIGDIVYVENIGAYSIASATQFNSLPLARVVCV